MNTLEVIPQLAAEEGFRSNPYKDTEGYWTFGEGRCLETSPLTGSEWKYLLDSGLISVSITQLGARHLTEERVALIHAELTARWAPYATLAEGAQDVLVDMCFQMGVDAILGWDTFLGYLAQHDYIRASEDGRQTKWYTQTPHRAQALMDKLETTG